MGTEYRLKRPLVIGRPEHFRWLDGVVRTVLVLNLVDAVLTLLWVRGGFATEANPFVRMLVEEHAVLFVLAKIGLVSLGSLLLWRLRHRATAVVGIFLVFLAYYYLLLFHIQYASILIRSAFEG